MKKILLIVIVSISFFANGQISNLDAFIEEEMEYGHIPGVAACVVKNGEVVWQGTYGFADIEQEIPVSPQTLFTVASISKLFVGTCVMQLVEEETLSLNDNINDYLPFEVVNPHYPFEPITIKMLLQHRSSITDSEYDMIASMQLGDPEISLLEYLENYLTPNGSNFDSSHYASNYPPDGGVYYSNVGFSLLGLIIENVSGLPFKQYCRQEIFEPLCMEQSCWFLEDLDTNNLAKPYSYSGGAYQSYGYYGFPLYPGALLKTNLEELSRFLIAYTNRGTMDGVQVFMPESADLLTPYNFEEENLAWWNGTWWTYTFHFPDYPVWFHGGFLPGIRTRINYYPSDSTGLIILTNGEGQYAWIEDTLQYYIPEYVSNTPDTLPCSPEEATLIKKPCEIQLGPNPFSESIVFDKLPEQEKTLFVYSVEGKVVAKIEKILGSSYTFEAAEMRAGLYFYKIIHRNTVLKQGKIIKVD